MMATEIFNIDASWAEKLMKKRVSFLTAPTVLLIFPYLVILVTSFSQPSLGKLWLICFLRILSAGLQDHLQ